MTSLAEHPQGASPNGTAIAPPGVDRPAAAEPPPVAAASSWPSEDYRGWASL